MCTSDINLGNDANNYMKKLNIEAKKIQNHHQKNKIKQMLLSTKYLTQQSYSLGKCYQWHSFNVLYVDSW